jgi:hypothetical protein
MLLSANFVQRNAFRAKIIWNVLANIHFVLWDFIYRKNMFLKENDKETDCHGPNGLWGFVL